MVEGSRKYNTKKNDPEIFLDFTLFPSGKDMQYGEKGVIEISGVIVKERVDEEDGKIIKTIRLLRTSKKVTR